MPFSDSHFDMNEYIHQVSVLSPVILCTLIPFSSIDSGFDTTGPATPRTVVGIASRLPTLSSNPHILSHVSQPQTGIIQHAILSLAHGKNARTEAILVPRYRTTV